MNLWREIENWYSYNGISTAPFFDNNPTEIGREEMLYDFAFRMIIEQNDAKELVKKLKELKNEQN